MQEVKDYVTFTAESLDNIYINIEKNKLNSCKKTSELSEFRANTPIAIVGGGPSLETQLDQLRKYKYIMACGSVHDYLLKNFIVPNWCIVVDPSPIVIDYIQTPVKTIKYLLASQCHPEVFEYLKDYKISLWHSAGAKFDNNVFGNELAIGGGCTVGTRAIIMAMAFGYYKLHLFGFDSCLDDNYKHHAYSFQRPKEESLGKITEVSLGKPDGRKYKVADYMLAQFMDFKHIIGNEGKHCEFKVFGEGLLKELCDLSNEVK